MIVHFPYIKDNGKNIDYTFDIEYNDGTVKNIFISVGRIFKEFVSDYADAALLIALLPAMVENDSLTVKGKVSKKLADNLDKLQNLIIAVIPWLYKIKINLENVITDAIVAKKEIVMSGFSAGVDAFVTLQDYYLDCKNDTKITHLIFNNLIYNETVANDKFDHIKKLITSLKIPLIQTTTNFHDIYAKKKIGFEQTHPIRNAAIAHILGANGIKFLYSSSFPLKDFEVKPWSDIAIVNKILLPLLSTDKVEILDVGSEYNRVEKTEIISLMPYTYNFLDICIGKKHLKSDYYNCSQCYKCMRALVTFEELGVLENYSKLFDLELYKKNKDNYLNKVYKSKQLNDVDLVNFLERENKMKNPSEVFKNVEDYNLLLTQSNNRIRENKKTILETFNGTKIAARHNIYDVKIIKEQFLDLQYFPSVIEKNWIPKVVLDIGGYIGDLSLYCASEFSSKVYCYEPTPQNYKMIKTNLELNPHLESLITVHNKGISNSNHPIKLNVQEINGEIHASSHKKYKTDQQTIEVPCVSLNEAINQVNEPIIDLLKIDCEGQEFEILKDIDSKKLSEQVIYIAFEYHKFVKDYVEKLDDILKNLEQNFEVIKKSKKLVFLKSKV